MLDVPFRFGTVALPNSTSGDSQVGEQPKSTRSARSPTRLPVPRPRILDRAVLRDARKQIRLLSILPPGANSTELSCTLATHLSSDVSDQYVAISYTWKSSEPDKTIVLDGVPITVGHNCWQALWQMRLHGVCERYWIDSICINHNSHDEKVLQVGMMDAVYAQAKLVAVCIGAPEPHLLGSAFDRKSQATVLRLLSDLAGRPYFKRLWTVQEFLLAKKVQVFCGEGILDWNRVSSTAHHRCRTMKSLPGEVQALLDFSNDYTGASKVFATAQTTLRLFVQERRAFGIADAILRYQNRQCTFVQDKVYGLLSLIPIELRIKIPVDYKKPLFQVLTDYASVYDRLLEDNDSGSYGEVATSARHLATVDFLKMGKSVRVLIAAFSDRDNIAPRTLLHEHFTWKNVKKDLASVVTNRQDHFDPRQVQIDLSSFVCHDICFDKGDMIYSDTNHLSRVGGPTRFRYCSCCISVQISDFGVFSPYESFLADLDPAPSGKNGGFTCVIPDNRDEKLSHYFAVPPGTKDGDVLVCFDSKASGPDFSLKTTRQRVIYACRPLHSEPSKCEVVGQAFHMSAVPEPKAAGPMCDSPGAWTADRVASISLTPTDLVAASALSVTTRGVVNALFTNVIRYNTFSLHRRNPTPVRANPPDADISMETTLSSSLAKTSRRGDLSISELMKFLSGKDPQEIDMHRFTLRHSLLDDSTSEDDEDEDIDLGESTSSLSRRHPPTLPSAPLENLPLATKSLALATKNLALTTDTIRSSTWQTTKATRLRLTHLKAVLVSRVFKGMAHAGTYEKADSTSTPVCDSSKYVYWQVVAAPFVDWKDVYFCEFHGFHHWIEYGAVVRSTKDDLVDSTTGLEYQVLDDLGQRACDVDFFLDHEGLELYMRK